jgi:cytochrome c oxidase subunit 2
VAWALAVICWLVSLATVVVLASRHWWFPPPISDLARRFDNHFVLTLLLCGFFFVLAQAVLGYIVIRFRDAQNRRAAYGLSSAKWVAGVALSMVLLDASLSGGSGRIWKDQMMTPSPGDALRIDVTGQQFVWNIHYPGPDGKFGRTSTALVNDSAGNPLGLDPKDPDARDDIVIPILLVPVNRPIKILLHSKDVIHSFFIRELRVKQDAVPGMEIPFKFTATQVGRYEIVCAELCGLGHHKMRSYLEVLEPGDFEARLRSYQAGQ